MRLGSVKNRVFIQRIVVSTSATMLSWFLGELISNGSGIVAAIVTIITLRISLQASISEAFTQIIGTALGVFLAFITLATFGQGVISVGLTIVAAFVIMKLLDLGDDGLSNISVTAIIVLAPGLPEQAASERFLGTLIGALIAILFSFFNHPDSPVERVERMLNKSSWSIANLLSDMSSNISKKFTTNNTTNWLERARRYNTEVEYIRPFAEELLRYSKWSPRLKKEDAQEYYNNFVALEHTAIQVRTIARALYDSKLKNIEFSPLVLEQLVLVINQASKQVKSWQIDQGIEVTLHSDYKDILKDILDKGMNEFEGEINEDQILILASIITNAERINDSLTFETNAIIDVSTPKITNTTAEKINSKLNKSTNLITKKIRSIVNKIKARNFFI